MAVAAYLEQQTSEHQQPPERARSFNPAASVHMMRFDILNYGMVLAETRERARDEELSYLVEGTERAARTKFVLKREGNSLVYFSKGTWRPYVGTLLTGQAVARAEANIDPRRQFLASRADTDLYMGYQMQSLRPGERLGWYSAYPKEEEARYGKAFIQARGFYPDRGMGFLYEATCQADGSVLLESQTVDNSDDEAFQSAGMASGLDNRTALYDSVLKRKHGGDFYAGRRESEKYEDAWALVTAQRDLTEYLLSGLEAIAHSSEQGAALEYISKRHVYGVWAAFKKRFDGEMPIYQANDSHLFSPQALVMLEVQGAYQEFVSLGKVLIGCGGEISVLQGEESIMNASGEDVFKSIFGNEEEDKYGSLTFKCEKGHSNKRPRGELIDKCLTCDVSVRCED